MILIADSGSTKTEWNLIDNNQNIKSFLTSGINPFYQTSENIVQILKSELPTDISIKNPKIYYFGTGCANEEKNNIVKIALYQVFESNDIFVGSDLLGAAKALCQDKAGIACILGTGSNSCYYDGENIVSNVSPLGFILGDEGSGAVMGKKLVADILKKQLPQNIVEKFFETYKVTAAEILDNVYKKPFPNRYLAQYTKFLSENIENVHIEELVVNSFMEFIKRNILQYPQAQSVEINFTGSIAFHFKEQLIKALEINNLKIGKIVKAPMEDMVKYMARIVEFKS